MKREDLEAKVTALLLGELPENEAALLQELIARDAGLARLHGQLKLTLDLLRETTAAAEPVPAAPLKLSEARREKLLAQFKTIALKEFEKAPTRMISWPFAIAAVAGMAALLTMMLPTFSKAKTKGQASYSRSLGWKSINPNPEVSPAKSESTILEAGSIATKPMEAAQSPSQIVLPSPAANDRIAQSLLDGDRNAESISILDVSKQSEGSAAIIAGGGEGGNAANFYVKKDTGEVHMNNGALGLQGGTAKGPTPEHKPAANPATVNSDDPATVEETLSKLFSSANSRSQNSSQTATPMANRYMGNANSQSTSAQSAVEIRDFSETDKKKPDHGMIANGGGVQSIGGTIPYVVIAPKQSGLAYVTATNKIEHEHALVRSYFTAAGIDLTPSKLVSFNDQTGELLFRGTRQDLKIVQEAVGLLNPTQQQVIVDTNSSELDSGSGLFTKKFYVDPKNFLQGLQNVATIQMNFGAAPPQPAAPPLLPQPEVLTASNIFSTFSLNVSDAAFKLAQASLQNGAMPEAAAMRSEEFINAFDYHDPEPTPGAPIGFTSERAAWPFAHHRDLLRFSVKTAAQGREAGRPLNLVLLLDKSGSMERADRVEIIHQALRVLASQLNAQDTLSVVVFARTPRLLVDGAPGTQAGDAANRLDSLTPEGGTNLEEAMKLAYQTALRHYKANGENRVVLLTDGAANLGNVEPETLKQNVEANRKQGIALDCFGVGFDGYNDTLMETLSRTGHGRYGFINTPEEAATEFAGKLAGALRVAASDVKVQVEFNPNRVTSWRQIGYAKHQLTKEQFRDNKVAAAQIGAAESGNALYTVEVNPAGDGPLCTVRVRFRLPGTSDYQEHAWDVPYTGTALPLEQATPAMRLAATSAAFSEWLAGSPFAGEVTPDLLLAYLRGVPEVYGADARPKNLEWMIRQAKSISGK